MNLSESSINSELLELNSQLNIPKNETSGASPSALLKTINADLHIHTCLSPCGSLDMTPIQIVREALAQGLSMIAITDHNSAENVPAVMAVAREKNLCVIPGLEITSSEEAHIVALFNSPEDAHSMQEIVFQNLLPGENDEDLFGIQVIADEFDNVDGINTRLLIGATTLTIEAIVQHIHERNGMAIPAHIDRDSYSIISQLGFIPPDLDIDAIEISSNITLKRARELFQEANTFSVVTSSDSHDLSTIGKSKTKLLVQKATFEELKMAIKNEKGRKIIYE